MRNIEGLYPRKYFKAGSLSGMLISNVQKEISNILDPQNENGIIMLKPSGMSAAIEDNQLKEIVEQIIWISELKVIKEAWKLLDEKDVNLLYHYPTEEDRKKDIYKQLVQHLTSGPIHTYYLEWSGTIEKCKIIKKHIREAMSAWLQRKEYIKNWLHTAEKHEIESNLQVLFDR